MIVLKIMKFMIKLLAKLFVLPCILLLSAILTIYSAVDSIVAFIVGLVNILVVIGVVAAVANTKEYNLLLQAVVFFGIETVVLVLPQMCAVALKQLRVRLIAFMVA